MISSSDFFLHPTCRMMLGLKSAFYRCEGHSSAFSKMRIMKDLYRSSMLLLLFVIIGVPTAAQNNLPAEVREMARKVMMPVVYKVPGMDRVKVVQNLNYTTTNDPNVLMDVYLSANAAATEKLPAVIFIQWVFPGKRFC